MMKHRESRFAAVHPAVGFAFFIAAILFSVVFLHPAYLAVSGACALLLLLSEQGVRAVRKVLVLLPLFAVISAINPLFNTYGATVLFRVFGRPYTLEALCYGMAIAGMLVCVLLWFASYNIVMTSDKFTSLFGNVIPALSLILVMILRLVPSYQKKAAQFTGARRCIGKGADTGAPFKVRLESAMAVLSALTGWAFEGAVETGDSMRGRGYGTARRSTFQIYKRTWADFLLLAVMVLLAAVTVAGAAAGWTRAAYTPELVAAPVSGIRIIGICAYGLLLVIPSLINIREVLKWIYFQSKI